MFTLSTHRLRLIPLNLSQLRLLRQDRQLLEQKLGLQPSNMVMDKVIAEEIRDAMYFWELSIVEDHVNYPWHTTWEIILLAENRSIGNVGLSGLPDEKGETGVGYSIDLNYHNRGYMTEALKALMQWAFQNIKLKRILAETNASNFPSHRVLEKCGFHIIENPTDDGGIMWSKNSYLNN